MFQQTPQKRVLFSRTPAMAAVGVFGVIFVLAAALLGGFIVSPQKALAANATNSTLNFQARLENTAGAIVPDGNYNVQFKLYDGGTAGGPAGKGAANAGTNLWTETWQNSNSQGVRVVNGYLSVSLGSVNPFPNTINWDQGLWLTMNIGGTDTGASPVYDGEMNPRLKLTGVPYALRAGQLAAYNSTGDLTSTLSLIQPTVGNQTFQIADQGAAGTYTICVQSAAANTGGCAPTTGGSGYIQNQNTAQQGTSNFWISGSGRADTSLLTPAIDVASAGTLSIGTSTATTVNIATNNAAHTIAVGTGTSAQAITIGSTSGASSLTLRAGTGNISVSGAAGTTYTIGATNTTGTTTIGQSTATNTINIGNAANTNTQTINIGTGSTGAGKDNVTIGSTNGASTTTIQAGTGNIILNSAGTIELQDSTNVTGTLAATTQLTAPLLDTASAGTLSIGTTNATGIALNKNVTVAAGQYISLVGGITSTRPASPTEGMLYYDTTTKGLIVYSNGKWQADRSSSTVLVGTSASGGTSGAVASKAPDGADYVNTSTTSAQTTINSAIAALPSSGGTVYLMEGTYVVDGSISLPSNVTLRGAGQGSTIIKLKNSTGATTVSLIVNSDSTNGNNNITLRDLTIDGNKANNATGSYAPIELTKVGSGTGAIAVDGVTVTNVTVTNSNYSGIRLNAIANSYFSNVTVLNSVGDGITGSSGNVISNSIFTNLNIQANGSTGLSLTPGSDGVTISNSVFDSNAGIAIGANAAPALNIVNNTFTGNVIRNNAAGITLTSTGGTNARNTITGNTITNNSGYGINLNTTADNTVSGNVITSSANHGIQVLSSNNNTITGNRIDNSGTGITNADGINVTTSNNNTIANNIITDTAGGATAYAIEIASGTSNYLSGNTYSGTGASSISDAGTTTIYANQLDSNNQLINRSSGGLSVQNSSGLNVFSGDYTNSQLVVGQASGLNGKLAFANATNGNLVTIVSGTTTGTGYQLTLPTALSGAAGDCLKDTTGTGVLGFASCGTGGGSTLQAAYTASTNPEIVLDSTRGALTVRNDGTNSITGNLLEIQNNAGTATFLGVSSSAFTLQDTSGNNALQVDLTGSVLKVFENVANPTNYASISYSSGTAVFSASSGVTQIGSGSGNVTSNLTGQNDSFSFSKTYTAAAAYSNNDFTIQRAVTGGTNTLTGSVLKVEDISSATTAGNIQPSVLLINQSNSSAAGYLLNAQSAGVTKLSVSNSGNLVVIGSAQANSVSSNTYDGSGALTIGASGATGITIGRSAITTVLVGTVRLGPDASNNMTISSSTGEPTLNGNARHTRKVTLTPEYAGASMTGDGTSNNGTMTSDNETTSPFRNYYKWTTTQGTAQDYDIWVKVPVPSDYSGLPSGQTICIDTYASATTANLVNMTVYGTNNVAVITGGDVSPLVASSWQNKCTTSITSGTFAADGVMTLDIKLTAPATTGEVRIGNITFSYLSKW